MIEMEDRIKEQLERDGDRKDGGRQQGEGGSAKSDRSESKRFLRQVNNLRHLSCSSLSIGTL